MTRQNLTKLVEQPALIGSDELKSLELLIDNYPYCQTLHILKTKGMHNVQDLGYAQQLKLTAITVSDRKKLYEIIMRETLLQQIREVEKENQIEEIRKPIEEKTVPHVTVENAEPVAIEKPEPVEPVKENTGENSSFVKKIESQVHLDPFIPITPVYLLEKPLKEEEKQDFSKAVEKNIPLTTEASTVAPNEENETKSIVEERKIPAFKISGLEQEILYEAINSSIQSEVWNDIVDENPDVKTTSSSFEKPIPVSAKEPMDFFGWLHSTDEKKAESEKEKTTSGHEVTPEPQIIPKGQVKNLDALIDRFIQNDPKITPAKAEFYSPTNVAKLSIVDKEEFVSETLAKIYEKQGYFDKAISVYRKLSLKFPEKNSYFASLIEKTELQKALDKQKKQK